MIRAPVKPELLRWARERAGLEVDALARGFPGTRSGRAAPRCRR